jgi:tight adherence protein B
VSPHVVGLLLGAGVFCIYWSFWPRQETQRGGRRNQWSVQLRDHLTQAGLAAVTPTQLIVACLLAGAGAFLLLLLAAGVPSIALAFAVIAGSAPLALVRLRARARRSTLREVWPDAVDNIASAVRAGLSLPEALSQLGTRGPEELRPAFTAFALDYQRSGRFSDALDLLKERLSDPVADRLVESLRLARDVGGSDLGRLLRTLSQFLREDSRTRGELEARQSWTVNAARLAVAAPWIVLAMLALRGESLAAYGTPAGWVVLLVGAGVCLLAYRLMMRIGRLPEEQRVMR